MADTQRTRAQLLALFADNVTGQISAQDLRDFLVTIMEAEFVNPGDFWKGPDAQRMSGDRTVNGWIDYSQIISVTCSMADALMLNLSGAWSNADVTGARSDVQIVGLACDSYEIAGGSNTVGNVLRKGLIKVAAMSIYWSEIGRIYYLDSGTPFKYSVCSAALMSIYVTIGSPEPEGSDYTVTETDVFRFTGWGISEDY